MGSVPYGGDARRDFSSLHSMDRSPDRRISEDAVLRHADSGVGCLSQIRVSRGMSLVRAMIRRTVITVEEPPSDLRSVDIVAIPREPLPIVRRRGRLVGPCTSEMPSRDNGFRVIGGGRL